MNSPPSPAIDVKNFVVCFCSKNASRNCRLAFSCRWWWWCCCCRLTKRCSPLTLPARRGHDVSALPSRRSEALLRERRRRRAIESSWRFSTTRRAAKRSLFNAAREQERKRTAEGTKRKGHSKNYLSVGDGTNGACAKNELRERDTRRRKKRKTKQSDTPESTASIDSKCATIRASNCALSSRAVNAALFGASSAARASTPRNEQTHMQSEATAICARETSRESRINSEKIA